MKKLQIGVIGSVTDIKLNNSLIRLAKDLGKEIARNNAVLVFGFEGDFDSLPSMAAKSAEEASGETVAFVWGSQKQDLKGLNSSQIITGQKRGGGREFSLVLNCNTIIAINGGSGTLMEIAMAYQAGIPVVALQKSGGWSTKLANTFLDERKRQKVIGVNTAKEAVKKAIKLTKGL